MHVLAVPSAILAQASPPDAEPSSGSDAAADEIGFSGGDAASSTAASDSSASGDELGFGTPGESSAPAPESVLSDSGPSPFTLWATLRLQGALRTQTDQPSRLAKLRQVLDATLEYKSQPWEAARLRVVASLHLEADFAYLRDLGAYDAVTLDTQAWQIRPGELYAGLSWGVLEASYGYQIVNLGQGEILSVLDLVNPRDLREPLSTDLSVMHLPVVMSRIGLAIDAFRLNAVVVHEAYFGMIAPPLGEFSPFRRLLLRDPAFGMGLAGRPLRNTHFPERDILDVGAIQPYGQISFSVRALDVALVAGSPLDAFGMPSLPDPAAFSNPIIEMPTVHPRYTMLGHSGAYAFGSFVLRWELAYNVNRPFAVQATDSSLLRLTSVRRNQLQGMLGLTYLPSASTNASLEYMQSHVFADPIDMPALRQQLLLPVEAPQLAFHVNHRFLSDSAAFTLVALLFGVNPVNAGAARVELSYMLSEQIEIAAGYVMYRPTRHFGLLYGLDRNDRIFVNLRWEISD